MYRNDFEDKLKGKASLDLDKTPGFLHVKHVTKLLKEVTFVKLKNGTIYNYCSVCVYCYANWSALGCACMMYYFQSEKKGI